MKQVRFPGGQVDFTYKSTTNPLLEKILVTNMFGTAVRQIDFDYGTGSDERLLMSVDFSDEGVYAFDYHASRFSGNLNAQDWWGYCNGKANTELVPQIWLKTYSSSVPGESTSYRQYDNAWKLERQKDKDGKVVEQYAYHPLNGSGITLPETETDVPVVVQFTGISQSGSTASAQIVCTGDCQVTFYLLGEANEGMAEYMLDGNYYSYTGTFGDYVTLNLTEGSHSFSASVSSSESASLYVRC